MKQKAGKQKTHATHITTPTGARVYIRGRTKEELEKKVMQAQLEMRAGVDISSDLTFREYAETWLVAYKKGKVRDTTYVCEGLFKSFARALRQAKAVDPNEKGVPSSKGVI